MDDQKDSLYSRTPQLEDLLKVCQALNAERAAYLVIGGCAVILQGGIRATKDVDLLVDPSIENIKKVKKALMVLPDQAASQIADDEVRKYQVVRLGDEIVIDLMAKACGIDYAAAKGNIEWKEVEGVHIPIASKELLIRMKDTLRPSDKADVLILRQLIEDEMSEGRDKA